MLFSNTLPFAAGVGVCTAISGFSAAASHRSQLLHSISLGYQDTSLKDRIGNGAKGWKRIWCGRRRDEMKDEKIVYIPYKRGWGIEVR